MSNTYVHTYIYTWKKASKPSYLIYTSPWALPQPVYEPYGYGELLLIVHKRPYAKLPAVNKNYNLAIIHVMHAHAQ